MSWPVLLQSMLHYQRASPSQFLEASYSTSLEKALLVSTPDQKRCHDIYLWGDIGSIDHGDIPFGAGCSKEASCLFLHHELNKFVVWVHVSDMSPLSMRG